MAAAQIIPFSGQAAVELARQHALPACTVLTPELAKKLKAVNDLTRRLKAAGVKVEATSPLDVTLFISADESDRFAYTFRHEWKGAAWSSKGTRTLNSVTLSSCRVCWFTPVKEQDQ